MGEAKRKRRRQEPSAWPHSDRFRSIVDLHALPPDAINGARIREFTEDDQIPDTTQVLLRAFRAVADDQTFHVGFCLGDGRGSALRQHARHGTRRFLLFIEERIWPAESTRPPAENLCRAIDENPE